VALNKPERVTDPGVFFSTSMYFFWISLFNIF